MLHDDFGVRLIEELGLQDDTESTQATIISMVGENMISKVILEILKVLPESEHKTFESFMESGDLAGLQTFLSKYIPDLDAFVQLHAKNEYEDIKAKAAEFFAAAE